MKILKSVLTSFLILVSVSSYSQDYYKFHSVYIYNFTKYIQWPASYQSGDFVIGVLGDSPVIEHLTKMSENKTVGSQKFSIVKYSNPDDIKKCHMLFIPNNKSKDLEMVMAKLSGQSTLVITERPGMGKRGSNINFVLVDGKWKFELNQESTDKSNLKVSTELTRLAIPI